MRTSLGILIAALVATACGGTSSASPGSGPAANVIQFGGAFGTAYSPAALTVKVGDTVTWQGDFGAHPLVSGAACGQPDGNFAASSGSTFSFTFTKTGTYPYYCNVHCSLGMKGAVTVQ